MGKSRIIPAVLLLGVLAGCANPVEQGVEQLKEKNYEKAIASFEKITEKDAKSDKAKEKAADAFRGTGIAYYELQNYEQAKQAFLQALDFGTKETGTIYNFLGICQMQLKDYESAAAYFEKGLACEDNSDELIQEMKFNEISAYEELREWETAKAKMKDYIAQYPNDEAAAKEAEFLETR